MRPVLVQDEARAIGVNTGKVRATSAGKLLGAAWSERGWGIVSQQWTGDVDSRPIDVDDVSATCRLHYVEQEEWKEHRFLVLVRRLL